MFFVAWFWAFFKHALYPMNEYVASSYVPPEIYAVDPFHLPLINLVDQPGFAVGTEAEREALFDRVAGWCRSWAVGMAFIAAHAIGAARAFIYIRGEFGWLIDRVQKAVDEAKKALAQCRRMGGDRIGTAIELLAEADQQLRGAVAWPDELVMEVLVARLARL